MKRRWVHTNRDTAEVFVLKDEQNNVVRTGDRVTIYSYPCYMAGGKAPRRPYAQLPGNLIGTSDAPRTITVRTEDGRTMKVKPGKCLLRYVKIAHVQPD